MGTNDGDVSCLEDNCLVSSHQLYIRFIVTVKVSQISYTEQMTIRLLSSEPDADGK